MKKYLVTALFVIAIFIPHFAHADITSNLAAWWKYDEGTGTTASDSTGSGHTGTLNGIAGWTSSSKIGPYAVTVNGGTNGNGISISSTISVVPPFTFAEWIYSTISADAAFRNLFAQAGGRGYWWRFGVITPFGSGITGNSNTSISANTWHHIAIVADASNNVTYYLDGVADGTGTASGFTADGMGCDSGSGGECFTGNFDDARYYTRALSPADIAELYAYPSTTVNPYLIFNVAMGAVFKIFNRITTAIDTTWLTLVTPTAPRSNFSGTVGCRFVDNATTTITSLGAYVFSGSTQTHRIGLWNLAGTKLAEVSLNKTGLSAGFSFISITPISMTPDTYYIGEEEFSGGDAFNNDNSTITTTGIATINASSFHSGSYARPDSINTGSVACYGPVNFMYH